MARLLALRQWWCWYRLVFIACVSILEIVASAPFAVAASAAGRKWSLHLVMEILGAATKAGLACSLAVRLRRQRKRLRELRGVGNRSWRIQFNLAKSEWVRSTVPMPALSTLLALFALMTLEMTYSQCSTVSTKGTDSWGICPLTGIASMTFVLNLLQTFESFADLSISSRMGYEDVFPGVGGFTQLMAKVVKYKPQSDDCEAEKVCAICLDEFAVGDSLGQMGCGHQFHEVCLRKWLRGGGSCPFRCHTLETAAPDAFSVQQVSAQRN